MRVNFRGKNVNITNELKGQRNVFLCHWNMYVLEVKKVDAFDSDSDPDWLYLVQRNGMYIGQGTVSAKTCRHIWKYIKDYDDNIIYGYAGRIDRAMFKDFKEIVEECAKKRWVMRIW